MGGPWAPGFFLAPPGIKLYDTGRALASRSLTVSFCSLDYHSPHLMPWLEGDGEKPRADGRAVVDASRGTPCPPPPPQSTLMVCDIRNPTGRYLFPSVSYSSCDYMSPIVRMGKLRHEWSSLGRGVQPGSPELGCKLRPAWVLEVGRAGSGSTKQEARMAGELKGDPRAGQGSAYT